MPVLDLFSLKGKKVLVTGGAGGYGSHISSAMAEAGAITIIASRSEEKRQKVVDSINDAGYEAHSFYMDQGKEKTMDKLHEDIYQRFGALDVLVNNAVHRPMLGYEDPIDTWRESMEVNATGMFHITRLFAADMIKQESGNIINISSIYGMLGPTYPFYEGMEGGLKDVPADYYYHNAGIINLTRYLAARLGRNNIRVNTISPGGLGCEKTVDPFFTRYCKSTFLGKMAGPEDLKGAVVFLASDASSYITGVNLPVDAGFSAH